MGCWNATCSLTQMPIVGGEPIRAYFVYVRGWSRQEDRTRKDWSGTVGGSELATPFPFPLKGEYDEYGSIENIEKNAAYHAVQQHFDIYDEKEFEGFIKRVCTGMVEREDPVWGDPVGVGLFLVHDSIYQSVKETPYYERYYQDGLYFFQALDQIDWSEYEDKEPLSPEELQKKLEENDYSRSIIEEIMEGKSILATAYDPRDITFPYLPDVPSDFQYNRFKSTFEQGRHNGYGSETVGGTIEIKYPLKQAYRDGKTSAKDPILKDYLEEIALAYAFRTFMFDARKQWIPAGHKTQEDSLSPHLHLSAAMYHHLKSLGPERWDDKYENSEWGDYVEMFDIDTDSSEDE